MPAASQWNEFFIFDCGSVGESATLTCSLWDKDLLGKDDLMGSFTFDAGDLVAGDAPKDVWLESKHSQTPTVCCSQDRFVSLTRAVWRSGTGHKALKTMLS